MGEAQIGGMEDRRGLTVIVDRSPVGLHQHPRADYDDGHREEEEKEDEERQQENCDRHAVNIDMMGE